MAKRKTAPKQKAPSPRPKPVSARSVDSLRFLTVHIDGKKGATGDFRIVPTLEEAKSVPTEQKVEDSVDKHSEPNKKSPFERIHQQISEKIATHRALDKTMALLELVNTQIQFHFAVEPVLKKYATLIFEDEKRKVYSFDRVHAREIITSLREGHSGVQGVNQLPRLLLIGLVSEYDVFLHQLIRTGITVQKNAALSIDKSLTLKELTTFSTIAEASDYLIEREIDQILYDDHQQQLLAIKRLFNLTVDTKDNCVTSFLEICERRNLFTHNAGVVNARYINRCRAFGINFGKTKLGDVLEVDRRYFRNAIATIHELSIKLTQFLWRQLLPAEQDEADGALNDSAFELLSGDDYKLAERILDYGLNHTRSKNDLLRRMMAVNYANAIKLGGDKQRAEKELAKFDWSATNLAFQMSVAAVRDNLDAVVKLMPMAVKSNDLNEAALRRWPVFKIMRGQKPFQDKFKDIFGKDFISAASLAPEPPLGRNPITAGEPPAAITDLAAIAKKKDIQSKKPTRH